MKQLSIIGLSKAGKTCYIYAMSKTMIKGYDGINIIALDDELRDQLSEGWKQIRKGMQWPDGTDHVTTCEFDCSLNLHPIMEFCWNDFKGGSLTSMNEIDKKYKKEFQDYLGGSDGLLLFVPADNIQDILRETEDADDIMDDLEVLNQLFMNPQNRATLSRIPVTVVVTKADILSPQEKPYIYEVVQMLFKPLFEVGNNMRTLVVPVSIGENLGRGNQGQEIQGTVFQNPKDGNIHIPIVFNLYHFIKDCIAVERKRLGDIDAETQRRTARLRTAEAHNGFQRFWYGEDRDEIRRGIHYSEDQQRQKKAEIRNLEMQLDKVASLFTQDCKYYVNGQVVSF